jgi:hypothetical protein
MVLVKRLEVESGGVGRGYSMAEEMKEYKGMYGRRLRQDFQWD